ncbi:MAG: tetratricopeptide repeat protein [Bacteroidia bacterium]|nr:tetratricopeptide repeat protein [Bacteroidia bacterium]
MKKILVIVFQFIFLTGIYSQANSDSLKTALTKAKHDTVRCNILLALIEAEEDDAVWIKYNEEIQTICETNFKNKLTAKELLAFKRHYAEAYNNFGFLASMHGENKEALDYFLKSLKLNEELKNSEGLANVLINLGGIYKISGDIKAAMDCFERALKYHEQNNDKTGMAHALTYIGLTYKHQGNIPKALEYYTKSLHLREEIKDKPAISNSLNNIGTLYRELGDVNKAIDCYTKSLKIQEEIKDDYGLSYCLINIGNIYQDKENLEEALKYYTKGLEIQKKINDLNGMSHSLNNIGTVYQHLKNDEKALDYYSQSLKIQEEINDKSGMATSLNNIGGIYFSLKKYDKALEFCNKSLLLSEELGFPSNIKNAADNLYQIYTETGNLKLALLNYELLIQMRDSINNEENRKAGIRTQLKYDYDKKTATDSVAYATELQVQNAEIQKRETEIKNKKNMQYTLFGGLILVIVFAGFMYNRFKITQAQKNIIELQKEEVERQKLLAEVKQEEILDSINYAKRIQKAHMPTDIYMAKNLARLKKN